MFAFSISDIPSWGWWDVFFTLMVLFGVAGESIADWLKFLPGRHMLKVWSEMSVVVGIAGELLCLMISLHETASLNKEAAADRVIAESLVSTNLQLQKQIVQLQLSLEKQVRKITPDDSKRFIDFLKDKPNKKSINIYVEGNSIDYDFEYRNYAHQFRRMLTEAGYGLPTDDIIRIPNFGIDLKMEYTNRDNPFFIVAYGQQGNIQWPGFQLEVNQPALKSVMHHTSDDKSCLGDINDAFTRIGIVPDIMVRTDWNFVKKNGDWAIFIPPRF